MKKRIYFYQPAHFTYFKGNPCYWLPYSVGCLWAYCLQIPRLKENYECAEFVFKRLGIPEQVSLVKDPYMAVFSSYIWNHQYNLALAKALKEKFPNCIIVFGGPQVTKFPEEKKFFENHPFIDHIVNGEGEVVFADLLEDLLDNKTPNKVIKFSRLTNVTYPSPYSGGIFDEIVARHPEYTWQAVLETNRGCPYQCTFCDWGSAIYSKIVKISEERVLADIDWFGNNRVDYVFLADSNFGILYERDKMFAERLNWNQQNKGLPRVVIAQWAKNSKDRILDIAKIFFNGHNRGFTLSTQSMDDQVLEAIKRKNMEASDMVKMLKLCKEKGIPAYTEMLIGLPYETLETWKNNHYKLMELGQHNAIDVWKVQTLENSELNTKESRETHGIITIESPKIITGHEVFEGDVPEMETLVTGTKYMPTPDLIEGYCFSSIIMHYHYLTGGTYLLSRFLRKFKEMPYSEFYGRLESSIKENKHWISAVYFRLKKYEELLAAGRLDEIDEGPMRNYTLTWPGEVDNFTLKDLKHNSHTAIWIVGKPLLLNINRMFSDLESIFTNEFCKLDPKMYEQLLDFQKNIVYDKNKTYPIIQEYDYDFVNYIENEGVLEKKVKYIFEYSKKWETEKQFLESAYYDRRTRETIYTKFRVIDED